MAQRRKILVVDDHPLVREGLAQLLRDEGDLEVCAQADSYGDALQAAEAHQPDVVVLDILLKGRSGIDLIPQIRAVSANSRILVLSRLDETHYAQRCLKSGAMGYVSKSAPPSQIVEGIRALLENRPFVSEALKDTLVRRLAHPRDESDACPDPVTLLSNREFTVFHSIGRGMTSREIAASLHVSPKTVQTYREHIKTKLNLATSAQLTQRAVHWSASGEAKTVVP